MWGLLLLLLLALVLAAVLVTGVVLWGSLHPPRRGMTDALARGLPADPADLGMDARQWTLDRPDGAKQPVWELTEKAQRHGGTKAPREVGLTAVFIHGWAMSRYDMLGRLEPYRDHCDRFVLYDLRGHGDATGSGSRLSADEHHDLLDLLTRLSDRRIVLVGLSMGAVIAIHAMAEAEDSLRDRVKGIIAYGPFTDVHESVRGRLKVQQMPARPISDFVMLLLRAMGVRFRDLLDSARKVHCPMLIVHGERDIIAPLRHGEQIVDAAADATLHVIEGATHLDAPFVDPDQHERAVQAFLSDLR